MNGKSVIVVFEKCELRVCLICAMLEVSTDSTLEFSLSASPDIDVCLCRTFSNDSAIPAVIAMSANGGALVGIDGYVLFPSRAASCRANLDCFSGSMM